MALSRNGEATPSRSTTRSGGRPECESPRSITNVSNSGGAVLSCSYSMLGVVLMIISKTKKLTFHEMIAATGSLKSLSHCICFARLIAARCCQAKYDSTENPVRCRSVQIALAFRFVTRPAHSVGGYLWEGSARPLPLGNVSTSRSGGWGDCPQPVLVGSARSGRPAIAPMSIVRLRGMLWESL